MTLHMLLGQAAALVAVLVNSITITYFIGTSRWCKEVCETYRLPAELAERSTRLKRSTFPWALAGILAVIVIVGLGAAADPSGANLAASAVVRHAALRGGDGRAGDRRRARSGCRSAASRRTMRVIEEILARGAADSANGEKNLSRQCEGKLVRPCPHESRPAARQRGPASPSAGQVVGQIGRGLLVLLGVEQDDTEADAQQLADKTIQLRIFDDADGKMNLALADVGGAMLVVSQFTLLGDCRKGRRPSFIQAAPPELAERLYETFVAAVGVQGIPVATGRFRAMMQVELVNDGPVTLLLDSRKRF